MVTLTTVSRNLLVVAALALLFCSDAFIWHTIPLGFEGTLAYGGAAFWFGAILTVVALVLTIIAIVRHGRGRFSVAVCIAAVTMLAGYAAFAAFATP